MNHIEINQLFLSYVRTCISTDVQDVYFALNYWHETEGMLPPIEEFKQYLERYHERVFCYELYHQIRNRMERDLQYFQGIYLQSEVIKSKLPLEALEYYEVQNLEKKYMPDFILHTPGNFLHQLVVMEVKSNPNIGHNDIQCDILKIAQFIDRFNYEQGIFLAVNIGPKKIWDMIYESRDSYSEIPEQIQEKILIMVQDMPSRRYGEFTLQSICFN